MLLSTFKISHSVKCDEQQHTQKCVNLISTTYCQLPAFPVFLLAQLEINKNISPDSGTATIVLFVCAFKPINVAIGLQIHFSKFCHTEVFFRG